MEQLYLGNQQKNKPFILFESLKKVQEMFDFAKLPVPPLVLMTMLGGGSAYQHTMCPTKD